VVSSPGKEEKETPVMMHLAVLCGIRVCGNNGE
jgi:hypothetical protein